MRTHRWSSLISRAAAASDLPTILVAPMSEVQMTGAAFRGASTSAPSLGAPLLTEGDVMTSTQVAELLAVPKSTVEEWARRGIVPSRKRGKRRFFLRWEIRDWLIAADD